MEYKIISIDEKGNVKTVVESLSATEYKKIRANIRKLQEAMLCKDYYIIGRDNIQDLIELLTKVNIRDKYMFQTINRYTYNVLGVLYAWIEYYENHYKAMFAPIKQKYYDNHFDYRMMYNLRIYMTHCEMGVNEVNYNLDLNQINVYIDPIKLLENPGRLQRNFIPELQDIKNRNEKIDLYNLITAFKKTFNDMNNELLRALMQEIRPVYEQVVCYVQFDDKGNSLTFNICEKDTGKYIYGLSSFLGMFCSKF